MSRWRRVSACLVLAAVLALAPGAAFGAPGDPPGATHGRGTLWEGLWDLFAWISDQAEGWFGRRSTPGGVPPPGGGRQGLLKDGDPVPAGPAAQGTSSPCAPDACTDEGPAVDPDG